MQASRSSLTPEYQPFSNLTMLQICFPKYSTHLMVPKHAIHVASASNILEKKSKGNLLKTPNYTNEVNLTSLTAAKTQDSSDWYCISFLMI